jgi:glycosyltransferase involved in cell wall biosynthesis
MTTRNRVIHLVPALFGAGGVVGGAERYALELARAMATAVPTTLVSFGPERREETVGALRIRVLGRPWHVRGQRSNPVSTRLFAALGPATVVHCHQQHVLSSSLAALFCRFTRRKVFVSDLGGGGWDVSGYLSTDAWYHGHLHISQYSRRVFGHAEHPRAHVILGGVDTQRFCPDPGAERTAAVLYVGRLLPHKGIDYLIEGLPDGMELTVIGPPADARYLEDLRRLAAGKAVTFRHEVGDAELVRAYQSAGCIVLPSVYRTRRPPRLRAGWPRTWRACPKSWRTAPRAFWWRRTMRRPSGSGSCGTAITLPRRGRSARRHGSACSSASLGPPW